MIQNAFKMKLRSGFEAEYQKRHDKIWPELSQLLAQAGVLNARFIWVWKHYYSLPAGNYSTIIRQWIYRIILS
jgi:L-rhamnose mutarotase